MFKKLIDDCIVGLMLIAFTGMVLCTIAGFVFALLITM
ncbi:hypothetical protein vBPpSSYP_202 [Pseudomonas phage vB_PpS_SYP]|nr:hypothetical protein vBPpSSYP_202 [Pseudomonas phage vB_PpS_SYP]